VINVPGFAQLEGFAADNRMEFAFAFANRNKALRDGVNNALSVLKANGVLDRLTMEQMGTSAPLLASTASGPMLQYKSKRTLYIGVTGAAPPIDGIDVAGLPTGFGVDLINELAELMNFEPQFVILQNDAAYACLLGGKVDMLLCAGSSRNTFDPGIADSKRSYLLSDGYYVMNGYAFVTLK
jgi:ABC-type amino acid transport substrate-binding protein